MAPDPPIGADPRSGRFDSTFPAPPLRLETTRRVGQGTNRLVLADNLPLLRTLPDECIDLVYIDPPFATGGRRRSARSSASFGDRRPRDLADYLGWLNARLFEIHRVMAPTATLYVHLDWHVVHYVKVELDKLFGGEDHFRNEIVWHYNSGPRRRADFGRRHDLILRYSKTADYLFNPDAVRQAYSPDINVPASKAHYYHPQGKVMDDVWRIPIIPQNDRTERLGYPTQKPEALLDIIVRASSAEGQLVADFFCGSGTALAVAAKRRRRWIGSDVNPAAVAIAADRLAALPTPFAIERAVGL
jgi:site-specific DNA-methyltransferase (adenine-specific)